MLSGVSLRGHHYNSAYPLVIACDGLPRFRQLHYKTFMHLAFVGDNPQDAMFPSVGVQRSMMAEPSTQGFHVPGSDINITGSSPVSS